MVALAPRGLKPRIKDRVLNNSGAFGRWGVVDGAEGYDLLWYDVTEIADLV